MIVNNGFIANSKLQFIHHPGTGNKSCKVSDAEKLRLSNILIDRAGVDEFLKILYATGEKEIFVDLSNRVCRRYGCAWILQRRVKINRHTVWIFLHEVAHILDTKKLFTGTVVSSRKPHGPDFGSHLSCLYDIWMEYCDKGVVNTPQKPDKPNLNHDYFKQVDLAIPKKWRVPERRPRLVGGISLQVGDRVWFHARGAKIYAIVKKVNKKTCRVSPVDGSNDWRVAPRLLNKVDENKRKPQLEEILTNRRN